MEMLFIGYILLSCLICFVSTYDKRLETISTVNGYLNLCPKGLNQKSSPSPEPDLMDCKAWKENACCTAETSAKIKENKLHDFNFHHCEKPLSADCLAFFHHDYCFVECSPNTGPWLVHNKYSTLGPERNYEIPLCLSACDAWFNACKADLTCAVNWSSGSFDWSNGTNMCRKGVDCQPIETVYKTATNFCENVWDHTWKVVSDKQDTWKGEAPHCMHLITANMTAHNKKIARIQAEFIIKRVHGGSSSNPIFFLSTGLLYIATLVFQ